MIAVGATVLVSSATAVGVAVSARHWRHRSAKSVAAGMALAASVTSPGASTAVSIAADISGDSLAVATGSDTGSVNIGAAESVASRLPPLKRKNRQSPAKQARSPTPPQQAMIDVPLLERHCPSFAHNHRGNVVGTASFIGFCNQLVDNPDCGALRLKIALIRSSLTTSLKPSVQSNRLSPGRKSMRSLRGQL